VCFWLVVAIAAMALAGEGSRALHYVTLGPIILCAIVLFPLAVILLVRWTVKRVLWKVRNRLILTYLLMGLAPFVLLGTLAGIAGYLFAGQYATSSALSVLDQASTEVKDETASLAMSSVRNEARPHDAATKKQAPAGAPVASSARVTLTPGASGTPKSPLSLAVLRGGVWHAVAGTAGSGPAVPTPFPGQPQPSWLGSGFRGIVVKDSELYLCSVVTVPEGGRDVLVLGSMPLDKEALDSMAAGLGRILLHPGFSLAVDNNKDDDETKDALQQANVSPEQMDKLENAETFDTIKGGVVAPRRNLFDPPVYFSAPLSVTSWQTGKKISSMVTVISRPTVLYAHLFANSVETGVWVRVALLVIAIIFAVVELLALLMAAGLSRTITRSVADLYKGTTEIDRGNLRHRIRVARRDQLGALATSFNSMAASIEDLLQQQREKDRLLNELAIAQEVQTNLYPRSPVSFAQLEMHGVCMPARTVSGDYFDFIFEPGQGGGRGLCLAFGDISGKGISAAMLMASLHSAVRAFSLNTEEGMIAAPSPALLLELLNRHLYRNTAPEKYATLFLAYYDVASRRLTYSNGGHLPPLVISTDGRVQQLDCGGPVVGLLNDLAYEEATIELKPGDLMMAFTDGLTEPENETGEFGEQRLLDYVRVNKNEPLPELVAGALKTVQAWVGNQEQPDDMTLLLVRQI
jgi:sigma-B regulation protein RsbU (phosphoserine phosphatase)